MSFDAVSVWLGLSHVLLSSPNSPPALLSRPESNNKYLFSRRLYKLLAKTSGHAVCNISYEVYVKHDSKLSWFWNMIGIVWIIFRCGSISIVNFSLPSSQTSTHERLVLRRRMTPTVYFDHPSIIDSRSTYCRLIICRFEEFGIACLPTPPKPYIAGIYSYCTVKSDIDRWIDRRTDGRREGRGP